MPYRSVLSTSLVFNLALFISPPAYVKWIFSIFDIFFRFRAMSKSIVVEQMPFVCEVFVEPAVFVCFDTILFACRNAAVIFQNNKLVFCPKHKHKSKNEVCLVLYISTRLRYLLHINADVMIYCLLTWLFIIAIVYTYV